MRMILERQCYFEPWLREQNSEEQKCSPPPITENLNDTRIVDPVSAKLKLAQSLKLVLAVNNVNTLFFNPINNNKQ